MIYYNGVLVRWNGKKEGEYTETEQEVRDEIEGSKGIRQQYFADDTPKKVCLLYPRGKPKAEEADGFNPLKLFPIPLNSGDGQWRWTRSIRGAVSKTNRTGFTDHHRNITHSTKLKEKDIEFVWFLLNRSAVMNKYVFIEDLEGDAKKEVDSMATTADIKYMITGNKSPIARDEDLIREVAAVFGVRDVDKMKFNQIKIALLDAVIEGQEMKDKFVNFEKFEELTEGNTKRRAAFIARTCIQDKVVGYKDRAWYLMSGKSFEEKLVNVNAKDAAYREQLFIDEVVNNPNVQDRLYSAIGESDEVTLGGLRELERPALQKKYRELTGEFKNIKKEELVQLLCEKNEIEYIPVK